MNSTLIPHRRVQKAPKTLNTENVHAKLAIHKSGLWNLRRSVNYAGATFLTILFPSVSNTNITITFNPLSSPSLTHPILPDTLHISPSFGSNTLQKLYKLPASIHLDSMITPALSTFTGGGGVGQVSD